MASLPGISSERIDAMYREFVSRRCRVRTSGLNGSEEEAPLLNKKHDLSGETVGIEWKFPPRLPAQKPALLSSPSTNNVAKPHLKLRLAMTPLKGKMLVLFQAGRMVQLGQIIDFHQNDKGIWLLPQGRENKIYIPFTAFDTFKRLVKK